jgi:hypothetical protein
MANVKEAQHAMLFESSQEYRSEDGTMSTVWELSQQPDVQ